MICRSYFSISSAIFLLFFCCLSSITRAQEIIENPKLPRGLDSRRTVRLSEVKRFSDEGKKFILRAPLNLRLDENGDIYFDDYLIIHVLNSSGTLKFKLFEERGLGPGEIDTRPEYLILKDRIFCHIYKPPKVMFFSKDGSLIREKKLYNPSHSTLIGATNSQIYFILEDYSSSFGKKGYIDFPVNLYKASLEYDTVQKMHTYPRKHYRFGSGGWQWTNLNHLLYEDKYIFITHTEEYKIMRFNLSEEKVDLIFKRKYERVKRPPSPPRKKRPGVLYPPERKFLYDTALIMNVDGKIWTFTSTKDRDSNRLVDVFSAEGDYLDSFYLVFPNKNKLMSIYRGTLVYSNGFFYTSEQDEDGELSIAKYKLKTPPQGD